MRQIAILLSGVVILVSTGGVSGIEVSELGSSLIFHAPFDSNLDARVVPLGGDQRLYTAESLQRKSLEPGNRCDSVSLETGAGRYGDAIRFAKKTEQVVLYKATADAFQPRSNWAGTISFWMKLNPDEDLEEGYCDPLQFAQREWNDATLFVDFDRELPRDFRLGVFSDYRFWNPTDAKWESIEKKDRPMVVVSKPPFSRTSWTHVLFTFENINSDQGAPAKTTLYMNGLKAGELRMPLQFTWPKENSLGEQNPPAALMLGIYYIGLMDDLAVFSRALKPEEVQFLYELPSGISGLGN